MQKTVCSVFVCCGHKEINYNHVGLFSFRVRPNPQNPSLASVDGAILVEAHGLIGEMLSDPSVPPNIVSGLRAVANLLAPPPTISPLPMRDKSNRISISLAVFNNSESDSEENPYLGERTSNMPKVSVPRPGRGLVPSIWCVPLLNVDSINYSLPGANVNKVLTPLSVHIFLFTASLFHFLPPS